MNGDALAALLRTLEEQLLRPEFRRDRERVGALLAEDFREYGSSGREWSRDTILEHLAEETGYTPYAMEDFAMAMLSAEAALVTYRAVRMHVATLRCSVWVLRDGRWRLLFHQGTVRAQA